jgi:hypothetical protein
MDPAAANYSPELPDTFSARRLLYREILRDNGLIPADAHPELPGLPFELAIGLSDVQRRAFLAQVNLHSYRAVIADSKRFHQENPTVKAISGKAALETCFVRTAFGYEWEPHMRGGSDRYLCPEDAKIFSALITRAATQLNCISTNQGLRIAFMLKEDRRATAVALLDAIGADGLAGHARAKRISLPDPSWLKGFAETLNINVKAPQKLDEARRRCCNQGVIRTFFDKFAGLMDRDPALILNCDETHISSRKKIKVLVPNGLLPLKQLEEKLPHFSAMCTISGSGARLRPMIILPHSVNLPEDLERYQSDAYFAATESGWMTQPCFLIYVHFLYCELVRYREDLPERLQGETMLLILDGHTSRWTFEAMIALRAAGLDVLCLPAHCTHLLQPFDVSVASPVKAALVSFMNDLHFDIDQLREILTAVAEPHWLSEKRRILIDAFLNAWDRGASKRNIISGFRTTGIAPVKPEVPLANPFARPLGPAELFRAPGENPEDMNCALVTGDDRLAVLERRPNPIFEHLPEKLADPKEQWLELKASPGPKGRILSLPRGALLAMDGARWIEWERRKIYAHRRCRDVPMWDVVKRLARDSQVLMVFPDKRKCKPVSVQLQQSSVEHEVIYPSKKVTADQRTAKWRSFIRGETAVCLTTRAVISALPYGQKAFTVYPEIPTPKLYAQCTQRGSSLLFFRNDEELETFKNATQLTIRTVVFDPTAEPTNP